jgi:thioredoxin
MENYVLLDFWADWCAPCKMMKPIIDKIEADYPNLTVVRVNVDEDSAMVQDYNVSSVPTYILMNEDKEILSFATGAMPEFKFKKELKLDVLEFGENSTNAS